MIIVRSVHFCTGLRSKQIYFGDERMKFGFKYSYLEHIQYNQEMGLKTGLFRNLSQPQRAIRILWRMTTLISRLGFQSILPGLFKNYNIREYYSGIAQPKYFNSFKDVNLSHFVKSILWVGDLSKELQNDKVFDAVYDDFDYDTIVKSYFPTKNNAIESVNIQRSWENSYWNKANSNGNVGDRIKTYRKSDLLFADMISNAQGIYKIKLIKKDSEQYKKAKLFFGQLLQKYNNVFQNKKDVFESLVKEGNLYYLDYPVLREIEKERPEGERYKNTITPTVGKNTFEAHLEIPFAIFAEVQGYVQNEKNPKPLVCLASVFNETFYKDKKLEDHEIFHSLSQDILERERWEMAKLHIGSADANEFTLRIHLGWMHFGTSIYTSTFYNLARDKKQKWFASEFIDLFSSGLLWIDFLGNLTLVDHKNAMLEKVYYFSRLQTAKMIIKENNNLNLLNFDPMTLGKDCYKSDSIVMTQRYYDKLRSYVDYLFEKYGDKIQGRQEEFWNYLIGQLTVKKENYKLDSGIAAYAEAQKLKLDNLPVNIKGSDNFENLKRLMTNLAYVWTVIHAETFSMISVSCTFYTAPPLVSKPLSSLKNHQTPFNESQKREFLPPKQGIKDFMTLHKIVTYRQDSESIVSQWNCLPSKEQPTTLLQGVNQKTHFKDYWNDLLEKNYATNFERQAHKKLYDLHWFLPHEIPMSLNI